MSFKETVESYESFNNISEMMTYDSAKKNRVVMATVYTTIFHDFNYIHSFPYLFNKYGTELALMFQI